MIYLILKAVVFGTALYLTYVLVLKSADALKHSREADFTVESVSASLAWVIFYFLLNL